jgi:hypothetical protein
MTQHIHTVHLIFKTHLDIGFTNFSQDVFHQYFEKFIPQAIETARILREAGGKDRFIWTTGSWLIYEFLERADSKARSQMEAAIEAGDIVWHALPFTTHTELMDASLFRFGLSLSQRLDKRFGRQTIAGKMTDVPGHTRAMIPLLAEAGVQLLHLGANPASTPPDVPSTFVWRDEPSNTRVLVMYQRGSYGDTMLVPGLDEALTFAHTNDNHGPQTPDEARHAFDVLRGEFPTAQVQASTLDNFARQLLSVENRLPVVTQEMGDTWIQGVGTDPLKVSQFRELSRLRRHWLEQGADPDDPHIVNFSRALMMIPEHTWGMDEKTFLRDYEHYEKEKFYAARQTPPFQVFEKSWQEQRAYLDQGVDALVDSAFSTEARDRLQLLHPKSPDKSAYQQADDRAGRFETANFQLSFDPQTGAINRLVDRATGRKWAAPEHLLGLFRYQTFSEADYDRYWKQYIRNKRPTAVWSRPDNVKIGIGTAAGDGGFWQPRLTNVSYRQSDSAYHFLLELTSPDEAVTRFGCPARLVTEITLPNDQPVLQFDVQWFDKAANRLPEAIWFSFNPLTRHTGLWELDKMGECISPLDVIRNGNRKLHAVDTGVYYHDPRGVLAIESLDAPLVAPGEPSLLNFNNRQPPLRHGMHFNLYNNVWGTNFPMWYEDDARFRFVLRFKAK